MINKSTAIKLMIALIVVVIIFHLCVLLEFVSYEKVWAGRIDSVDKMRVFETISILINVLLIAVLYIKSKNIKSDVSNRVVNMIIGLFVILFALNTVGNLFATTLIERTLGTGLTFISAVLCWIIVKKEKLSDDTQI